MKKSKAYIGVDAHARNCVVGWRDGKGVFRGKVHHATSEVELVKAIEAIPATYKAATVEESTLAGWVARTLRSRVDEMVVCDPHRNKSISQAVRKDDDRDVEELSRLLWLGQLHGVYHPQDDNRAVFKALVQQYLELRREQVKFKQQLKAKFHLWGITQVAGRSVYSEAGRKAYLERLKDDSVRRQMTRLYQLHDETVRLQKDTFKEVIARGRRYPEIAEFTKMPGVGDVGAHVFDAIVQTPDRFESKAKLWRYCRLAVTDRSSDGKPLGRRRLDSHGNPELKAMSYMAWMASFRAKKGNEIQHFYRASLERTKDRTHARLNTQRKIVATMWAVWKNKEAYKPERFLSPADASDR
jgi:transposase